eukprot:scaffold27141_cov21-Tisochrysis_lutea.AAC.1
MIVVRDDRRVVRGKMREQEVGKGRRTGGANSYSIQAYVFHMLPDSLGCHVGSLCTSVWRQGQGFQLEGHMHWSRRKSGRGDMRECRR